MGHIGTKGVGKYKQPQVHQLQASILLLNVPIRMKTSSLKMAGTNSHPSFEDIPDFAMVAGIPAKSKSETLTIRNNVSDTKM